MLQKLSSEQEQNSEVLAFNQITQLNLVFAHYMGSTVFTLVLSSPVLVIWVLSLVQGHFDVFLSNIFFLSNMFLI